MATVIFYEKPGCIICEYRTYSQRNNKKKPSIKVLITFDTEYKATRPLPLKYSSPYPKIPVPLPLNVF